MVQLDRGGLYLMLNKWVRSVFSRYVNTQLYRVRARSCYLGAAEIALQRTYTNFILVGKDIYVYA